MNRLEDFRLRRSEVYNRLFSAGALCFSGLLAMPSMLFNSSTLFRTIQFLLFLFLCWLSGKKNNLLMTMLVILGIVAINLLVPYGRVLFSIGNFDISSGALTMGIKRAVTLEGLIMLSRLSIRPDLKLIGRFGELISESFRFFTVIMDSRKRITRKNFISDIDRLMLDLSKEEFEMDNYAGTTKTKPAGFAIISLALIISWLLWAAGLFQSGTM